MPIMTRAEIQTRFSNFLHGYIIAGDELSEVERLRGEKSRRLQLLSEDTPELDTRIEIQEKAVQNIRGKVLSMQRGRAGDQSSTDAADTYFAVAQMNMIQTSSLYIDFDHILNMEEGEILCEQLLEYPDFVVEQMNEILMNQLSHHSPQRMNVRVYNLPASSTVTVSRIKSANVGKLVQLVGVVRSERERQIWYENIVFYCPICHQTTGGYPQSDYGAIVYPPICPNQACSRPRSLRIDESLSQHVDLQELKIEERMEYIEMGTILPENIIAVLKEDLVGKFHPGQKVRLVGVVKTRAQFVGGKRKVTSSLVFDVNSVVADQSVSDIVLTDEDVEAIKNFAESHPIDLEEQFLQLLGGGIYIFDIYETVLRVLLYQQFGGVEIPREFEERILSDEELRERPREYMHVALFSDPSTAKSKIVRWLARLVPRCVYASGKSVSGAGLCVAPDTMVLSNPSIHKIGQLVEANLISPKEVGPDIFMEDNQKDVTIQHLTDNLKIQAGIPSSFWKLKSPTEMIRIVSSSGKQIEVTQNTMLLTIQDGEMWWKKSNELREGNYIATARRVMQGNVENQPVIDLIQSNPVIYGIKPFVGELVKALSEKYGTKRKVARVLGLSEDSLYRWVAKGVIKLNNLKKLCADLDIKDWHEKVREVSLYNGKKHIIPTYLNNDLLYFSALIAGDGNIRMTKSGTYSIGLSSSCQNLLDIFREITEKEFRLHSHITKGNLRRPDGIQCHSRILGEILVSLGIPLSPKSNKIHMTESLLHLPNSFLSHYIAGLFDTDGSIYYAVRRRKHKCVIEYSSCSEEMVRQLQLVLLRFNIHSKIRSHNPTIGKINGVYRRWSLEITGIIEIQKFYESIKLRHPIKKLRLESIIQEKIQSNTNIDIIPDFKKRLGISRRGELSVNWIQSKEKELTHPLKELGFSDIFWEKIRTHQVIKSSYPFVYDLTTPSHNFIANGFVVHNTCAIVKEDDKWRAEAGLLVLGHTGLGIIEEWDKLEEADAEWLNEALEHGTIHVAKGGIVCELQCKTACVFTANPIGGYFDRYKSFIEQMNIPDAIRTRMDIIICWTDKPDEKNDREIATKMFEDWIGADIQPKKLPMSIDFFKKYIVYVRNQVHPILTREIFKKAEDWYVTMRQANTLVTSGKNSFVVQQSETTVPITSRQFLTVIRLATNRARLWQRTRVSEEDIKMAFSLMDKTLRTISTDAQGNFDAGMVEYGESTAEHRRKENQRDQLFRLIDELDQQNDGKGAIIEDLLNQGEAEGLGSRESIERILEKLRYSKEVYFPTDKVVKRA